MSAVEIKTLTQPPNTQIAREQSLKWLNTHIPSFEDLQSRDDLDQLAEQARTHSAHLTIQLASSRSNIDHVITKTRTDARSLLETAQELSLLRHSLSDEFSYLSQELVSSADGQEQQPTLLEDLETLHRNLKELESVKAYVEVVRHALTLSEAAIREAEHFSSHSSVSKYASLQQFTASVVEKLAVAEQTTQQQTLHITVFLRGLRDRTWRDIKLTVFASLTTFAERLKWPLRVDYPAADLQDRVAFEKTFLDLLQLQELGERLEASENEGLYPIQAMVNPIALRFKFHFEGTRQTNQLDKPEWYFTHILNIAHDQRPLFESVIQRLLSTTKYKNIDAWREFVLLLLPMLTRKLKRSIPPLLSHPPLLAHTIYQALSFDGTLREEGFALTGTSAAQSNDGPWPGVSDVILGRPDWFSAWLQGENKFAQEQYHDFMNSSDAWVLGDDKDSESATGHELKPTNSARRVKALVEQVTDRYSPLPSSTHRTEFLVTIQLPILSMYHSRIVSSLDAFETLSSAFVRAVPGALGRDPVRGIGGDSNKRLTSGLEGIQRLCKALISAQYVLNAMKTWGEDLFFLELWTDIVCTSALRVGADENKLMPKLPPVKDAHLDGTLFDELITQYASLSDRAEDMVAQHIYGEVEVELRAHLLVQSSVEGQEDPDADVASNDIEIASTLLIPIPLLSSHLAFLQSVLPLKMLTDLYRRVATRLSTHILQRMIMYRGRGRIGPREARTIMNECELWLETCRMALSGARAPTGRMVDGPWRKLVEAGRLIAVQGQEWKRIRDLTFGMAGDEEWEQVVSDIVGISELTREEVVRVLQTRADYDP